MPGKVTRSSQPRIVSRHLDPPRVEPVNARAVKAHYVSKGTFTALQWAPPLLLCILVLTGVFAFMQARQTLTYAEIGKALCQKPLMVSPEYRCDLSDLDCMTHPEISVVMRMDEQIRAHNLWQAKTCIRVI